MPIESTFSPTEGILSPAHVMKPIPGFPETVLITFSDRMEQKLEKMHTCTVIGTLRAGDTRPIRKFTHNGKELGMYRTGLGGPAAAALMEEVIVMGAKRIFVFGSCGTLTDGIAAGKLILPTHAYRDEGTSYHYCPADDFIAVPTCADLAKVMDSLRVPYVLGKTWTTDAFYRETREAMEKRVAMGCICVEMECASLMAVGAFRHIPVYQFLYAADSLSGDTWEQRILGTEAHDLKDALLKVALDAAAML